MDYPKSTFMDLCDTVDAINAAGDRLRDQMGEDWVARALQDKADREDEEYHRMIDDGRTGR